MKWKRVTSERYDEMLNILPPAIQLGHGFLVGEAWTHRECEVSRRADQPAFAAFVDCRHVCFEAEGPMTIAEFRAVNPVAVWESTP